MCLEIPLVSLVIAVVMTGDTGDGVHVSAQWPPSLSSPLSDVEWAPLLALLPARGVRGAGRD